MECSQCLVPADYLGRLGNRYHFRCKRCGLDHSTTEPSVEFLEEMAQSELQETSNG